MFLVLANQAELWEREDFGAFSHTAVYTPRWMKEETKPPWWTENHAPMWKIKHSDCWGIYRGSAQPT